MQTHPIALGAVATVAAVRLARSILVPAVALVLVLAGWQPSQTSQPQPASIPMAAQPAPDRRTVAELRKIARQAGHRALARSGRRAELLAVLAA
jgi:hypothetical protein